MAKTKNKKVFDYMDTSDRIVVKGSDIVFKRRELARKGYTHRVGQGNGVTILARPKIHYKNEK